MAKERERAKTRAATPVTLTDAQRERLENQWFVYGNHGPKTTPGNHTFIQTILEHGLDIRPLRTTRTRKSEIPTPECEAAVDIILRQPHITHKRSTLRLVTTPAATRPRLTPDPDVTSMLDGMRRRHCGRLTHDLQDDTPDAA